ncbi:hypothetical protein SDC9_196148 [bioreactor metagenome]|uniref:Uncharacterized protein n=1 Tax=bioreactor metagenome TaxID=1076179 RepID=A0A645IB88_9ZZZZ
MRLWCGVDCLGIQGDLAARFYPQGREVQCPCLMDAPGAVIVGHGFRVAITAVNAAVNTHLGNAIIISGLEMNLRLEIDRHQHVTHRFGDVYDRRQIVSDC